MRGFGLVFAMFWVFTESAVAQVSPTECQRNYNNDASQITAKFKALAKAAEKNTDDERGVLKERLAAADAELARAVRALSNPGRAARDDKARLCGPLLATVNDLQTSTGLLLAKLSQGLDDSATETVLREIDRQQKLADRTYSDYQACHRVHPVTAKPPEVLQKDMGNASAAVFRVNNRLSALKRSAMEGAASRARQKQAALELAAQRRDQCVATGESFSGGEMLPVSCRCSLKSLVAALLQNVATLPRLRADLKSATDEYLQQSSDFVERLNARSKSLSQDRQATEGKQYFALMKSLLLGSLSIGQLEGMRAIERSAAGGSEKLKQLDHLMQGTEIGSATLEFVGAVFGDERSALGNDLSNAATAGRKLQKVSGEMKTALRDRAALWQAFLAVNCVREGCGGTAVRDIGSFGVGWGGQSAFSRAAFGEKSPQKRMLLAKCGSCKAIALVRELKALGDVASDNAGALRQSIDSDQSTLTKLFRAKSDFLTKDLAFGNIPKWAGPLMSLGAALHSGFAGAEATSLAPAAAAGEAAVAVARVFENGQKSEVDRNLSEVIQPIAHRLEDNLASLAVWQRYMRHLDRDMGDALALLARCVEKACGNDAIEAAFQPDDQAPTGDTALVETAPAGTSPVNTINGIPVVTLPLPGLASPPDCMGFFEPGVVYAPLEAQRREALVTECVTRLNESLAKIYTDSQLNFGAATVPPGGSGRPDCPYVYVPGITYTPEVIKERTAMVEACIKQGGQHSE